MTGDARAVARAFVDARRSRTAITRYPGIPPASLAAAYAIQDEALSLWGEPVGGWKVGRINPPLDGRLGADRLAGPALARNITESRDGAVTQFAIIPGGFAAGESEFMVRVAPLQDEAPVPRNDAETFDWIDEVRIGLEIAASPYAAINIDGPCVTVSDHGNNGGLILGAPVPRDRWDRLQDIVIRSTIDGREVGVGTARAMLDGPLGAVRFLLANLRERGITPQAGWWVSTGAVTGVHEMASGEIFEGDFEGIGRLGCQVVTATD